MDDAKVDAKSRDKEIERERYDSRAAQYLVAGGGEGFHGAHSIRLALRSPYLVYEKALEENLSPDRKVLEIGAGSGAHTGVLLRSGAEVIASDISERSLQVLRNSFPESRERLKTRVADIEMLPFDNEEFDVVAAAGCLSYGDNLLVLDEVYRVLKPGGKFICIDSLNENPLYRFNRWLHYLRKNRSKSTLERMPSLKTISLYRQRLGIAEVRYFGAISFLAPILAKTIGEDRTAKTSDWIDGFLNIKRSAFKFVMVATKDN